MIRTVCVPFKFNREHLFERLKFTHDRRDNLRRLNFIVRLARFKFTRSRMRIKTSKSRKDRGANELKF